MEEKPLSVYRKLIQNKITFASLVVVALIFLISVLGYLVSPDKSPNANRQTLELAAHRPGFKVNMLKIRKNIAEDESGVIKNMFFGKKDMYNYIPIDSFYIKDNLVFYSVYEEGKTEYDFRNVELVDAIFPLRFQKKNILKDGFVQFYHLEKGEQKESLSRLIGIFLNENIVQKKFLLGTDRFGRDLLSRMIIGARISLSVGFVSVFISLIIGTVLGLISGYFHGFIDKAIMFLINVAWSIPALLLALALSMVMGKGYWQLFLAIGLTMWVEVARIVRGQVLSVKEKDYITAAKVLGFSNFRILFKHILPNIFNPVIIVSAANFSTAILLEAGLSFLGIGVQPPVPSWGGIIRDHYGYIIVDQAFLALVPGIAIILLVLSFTFTGNGLRDALDNR